MCEISTNPRSPTVLYIQSFERESNDLGIGSEEGGVASSRTLFDTTTNLGKVKYSPEFGKSVDSTAKSGSPSLEVQFR